MITCQIRHKNENIKKILVDPKQTVVNTSCRHHSKKSMPLLNTRGVRLYTGCDPTNAENTFDSWVARVDFSVLLCVLVMYNTVAEQFDEIGFVDVSDNIACRDTYLKKSK